MFKRSPAKAATEPAAALLVAGTYEKAICGWELGRSGSVVPVFQHQSHLGPVKAVASQGKFLVSGGNDEEVRIYNIQKRFEVGSLMKHQAPITTLRFSRKANSLISGSDDGMIAVWRIKDWECVSFKKAHKGSVTDLDVHPSGKVMLSCGRDNALRLWDLSSSKELYCRAQKGRGYGGFQQLRWRPRGEGFCYALGNDVCVFDPEGEDAVVRFSHPRPPFSFVFLSETSVATGGEDKVVRVFDVRTGKLAMQLPEFSSRIRTLVHEPSNGDVAMYKTAKLQEAFWQEKTNMRITCACTSSMPGAAIEEEAEAEAGKHGEGEAGKHGEGEAKRKNGAKTREIVSSAPKQKVYEEPGSPSSADDDEGEEENSEEDVNVEEDEDEGDEEDDDAEGQTDLEEDEPVDVEEDDVDVEEDGGDSEDEEEEEEEKEAPDTRHGKKHKAETTNTKVTTKVTTKAGKKEAPYRVFSSLDDLLGKGVAGNKRERGKG